MLVRRSSSSISRMTYGLLRAARAALPALAALSFAAITKPPWVRLQNQASIYRTPPGRTCRAARANRRRGPRLSGGARRGDPGGRQGPDRPRPPPGRAAAPPPPPTPPLAAPPPPP